MTASRFNPVLRDLYERLRQAGKPPKLAFVAVARKLLTILQRHLQGEDRLASLDPLTLITIACQAAWRTATASKARTTPLPIIDKMSRASDFR